MPRELKQLTVFISCTSEAEAEVAALRRVAEAVSHNLETTHSVTLRIVGWPDDFRPGVNTDPQAEINRQLGQSVDVYVGILATRFGTPTPRAGSGTEEEFQQMLERFHGDPRSIRVMFYFKRMVDNGFAIDPAQLAAVQSFRSGLSRQGVVYRDFKDTSDFADMINRHLSDLVIQEWEGQHWRDTLPPPGRPSNIPEVAGAAVGMCTSPELSSELTRPGAQQVVRPNETAEDDEERGPLEYVEGFLESVEVVGAAFAEMGESTQRIGEKIAARTAELNALQGDIERQKNIGGSRERQAVVHRARETVDGAAADVDEYVAKMAPAVAQFKLHSRTMLVQLRHAKIEESRGAPTMDESEKEALRTLIGTIRATRESTSGFQASVSQVPALTGKFRRARARCSALLGDLVAELALTIDAAASLLSEVSDGQKREGAT
jgi:hypothetical protein